jgi:hypothetical protein
VIEGIGQPRQRPCGGDGMHIKFIN